MCYEQSNLRGSKVTLEKLEDDSAIVKIEPIFLQLYHSAGQIKNQISYEDYISIYETNWYDRAEKAGWNLDIIYNNNNALFKFNIKQ
jgi:hypothetical protein